MSVDIEGFVDRYVAMWNESNPERRGQVVRILFSENAIDFTSTREVRGQQDIEARVAASYDKWVATEGFVFRSLGNVSAHHDAIRFNWEMVPVAGGDAASLGFEFIILGDDGRIRLLYQFIDR
jgi:hypothetical protein